MEHEDLKKQARALINELLECPFAQTAKILQAEQKLQLLHEQQKTAIEPAIGLMFVNIMRGNRAKALELGENIWSIGGNLSPFFELLYSDCLLNLGELAKAEILLNARFENLGSNLQNFYMVLVKYALLSGKLNLLSQIGEYPNLPGQENELFKFARNHAANFSLKDYRYVLKTILETVNDKLCAWEYILYADEGIELVFYTADDDQQAEALEEDILNQAENYFASLPQNNLQDLFIRVESIKNHAPWLAEG